MGGINEPAKAYSPVTESLELSAGQSDDELDRVHLHNAEHLEKLDNVEATFSYFDL